jgi:serine/threonine protein kinase
MPCLTSCRSISLMKPVAAGLLLSSWWAASSSAGIFFPIGGGFVHAFEHEKLAFEHEKLAFEHEKLVNTNANSASSGAAAPIDFQILDDEVGRGSFCSVQLARRIRREDFPSPEEYEAHIEKTIKPHNLVRLKNRCEKAENIPEKVVVKRFMWLPKGDEPDDGPKEHPWTSFADYKASITDNEWYMKSTIRGAREEFNFSLDVEQTCGKAGRPDMVGSFLQAIGTNIPEWVVGIKDNAEGQVVPEGDASENQNPADSDLLWMVFADAGAPLRDSLVSLSTDDFMEVMHQLLCAFEILRKSEFVHHNFKMDNVMYNREAKRAVVIDFGSMTRFPKLDDPDDDKIAYTPTFIPPEWYFPVVKDKQNPVEVQKGFDVFSFACFLGECFCYYSPMQEFAHSSKKFRKPDYMDWDKWYSHLFEDPELCKKPKKNVLKKIVDKQVSGLKKENKHVNKYAPQLLDLISGKEHYGPSFLQDWASLFAKDPVERVENAKKFREKLELEGASLVLPTRRGDKPMRHNNHNGQDINTSCGGANYKLENSSSSRSNNNKSSFVDVATKLKAFLRPLSWAVLAAAVVLILCAIVMILCVIRRRKQRQAQQQTPILIIHDVCEHKPYCNEV